MNASDVVVVIGIETYSDVPITHGTPVYFTGIRFNAGNDATGVQCDTTNVFW